MYIYIYLYIYLYISNYLYIYIEKRMQHSELFCKRTKCSRILLHSLQKNVEFFAFFYVLFSIYIYTYIYIYCILYPQPGGHRREPLHGAEEQAGGAAHPQHPGRVHRYPAGRGAGR